MSAQSATSAAPAGPEFRRAYRDTTSPMIGGVAAGVKIGLEFFCANGDEGVVRIAEHGTQVFLDLKLHDIPNTVEKAVHALAHLQPAILTVHAAGGKAMMAAAKSRRCGVKRLPIDRTKMKHAIVAACHAAISEARKKPECAFSTVPTS